MPIPHILREDIFEASIKLDYICITTNSILNKKGELVMGAGIALKAKELDSTLPKKFGEVIDATDTDNGVYGIIYMEPNWIAFQTKIHYREESIPKVIKAAAKELAEFARERPDSIIGLPLPGIRNGGLDRKDVLPLLKDLPSNVYIFDKPDSINFAKKRKAFSSNDIILE